MAFGKTPGNCYHKYKLKYSLIYMYIRFMAAIFDLPVTLTSKSIQTNYTVFLDPENVGVAVGISLLSCIQAEIFVFA